MLYQGFLQQCSPVTILIFVLERYFTSRQVQLAFVSLDSQPVCDQEGFKLVRQRFSWCLWLSRLTFQSESLAFVSLESRLWHFMYHFQPPMGRREREEFIYLFRQMNIAYWSVSWMNCFFSLIGQKGLALQYVCFLNDSVIKLFHFKWLKSLHTSDHQLVRWQSPRRNTFVKKNNNTIPQNSTYASSGSVL